MKQIVLITGGSEGIGLAVGTHFHTQGDQVVLVGRSREKLEIAASTLPGVETIPADVSMAADVARLFDAVVKKYGRIDVVVHAAGSFHSQSLSEITDEEWERQRQNYDMTFYINRAAMRQMSKQGSGIVMNVSSRAGLREEVLPGSAIYGGVKNSMIGLTSAANQEHKDVRFIVLCPGAVDTKMGRQAAQDRGVALDPQTTLSAEEVAEAIGKLVAEAKSGSPHIYRLTKEDGLSAVTEQGWKS